MKYKDCKARFKSGPADDLAEGEFLVYPSTFIREPDAYGDVVAKGAFEESIARWKDSGNTLPGLFGHQMHDPAYYVAKATEMGEDDHGLWVRGEFRDTEKGRETRQLIEDRLLSQLSFAFDVHDEGEVDLGDGRKANELRKLHIHEFSFVPIGANPDTSIVAMKAAAEVIAQTKIGARHSKADKDKLEQIRGLIDELIEAADDEPADDPDEGDGDDTQTPDPAGSGDAEKRRNALAKLAQLRERTK